MNLRHLTCIALACVGVVAASGASAQRIGAAPQPSRQATTSSLPNPAGLAPPMAPTLAPPMPPSLASPGAPDLSPGTAPGSPVVDAGVVQPLSPSGVAVVQSGGGYAGANAMGYGGVPRGPYSAVDIERAFQQADINHDGELSRAEAQRLAIPVPFDELDRNHDGSLTHFEYEDFFR
jgi:hypothetical protein